LSMTVRKNSVPGGTLDPLLWSTIPPMRAMLLLIVKQVTVPCPLRMKTPAGGFGVLFHLAGDAAVAVPDCAQRVTEMVARKIYEFRVSCHRLLHALSLHGHARRPALLFRIASLPSLADIVGMAPLSLPSSRELP
jgi:hypothetical protein